ncbi:recombinase family protein [Azospirillum argentinense]|nr:recombinase family protein [Azospirillum argentinense]
MAVNRGYARETRNGMPIAQQLDALRAAGVEVDGEYAPVYIDRLPDKRKHRASTGDALSQRAVALTDLRPGGHLVVAGIDRLGVSSADIRAVIDTLIDRGCAVHDVLAGKVYDAATSRADLSAVTLAAESKLKAERVRTARAARAKHIESGSKAAVGGNRGWQPTPKEDAAAKHDWLFEVATMSQADCEKKHGVNRITLRRRYGARGARVGRRKKQSD